MFILVISCFILVFFYKIITDLYCKDIFIQHFQYLTETTLINDIFVFFFTLQQLNRSFTTPDVKAAYYYYFFYII